MPRALLHLHRAPDLPHAIPLLHVLGQTPGWEVVVRVTPYSASKRVGLPPVYEERLHRLGVELVSHSDTQSNADVCFFYHASDEIPESGGLRVQLPVSLIGKGLRYAGGQSADRDNLADVVCVPGGWHKSRLKASKRVFTEIEAVGLPGLDPIFGNWVADREVLRQQLRIETGQHAILYAPTWNPELSSVPLLWTRIRTLATPQQVVILRPHPYAPAEYHTICEKLALNEENVRLAREPDIQPYLHASDLVVSDTSSLAWEAAVLDKPVVRIDTPNRSEYPELDPSDPEYTFAGIGPIVRGMNELREAVEVQLANPHQYHDARMEAKSALVDATDGTACKRVLEIANQMLSRQATGWQTEGANLEVVMNAASVDDQIIEHSLESLFSQGREQITVRLTNCDQLTDSVLNRWRERWPDQVSRIHDPRAALLTDLPFILLMNAGVVGTFSWLFRLVNHLRRHPKLSAIAPLAIGGRPVQDPQVRMQQTESDSVTFKLYDELVRYRHAGQVLDPGQAPAADAILLRMNTPVSSVLANKWLSNQWADTSEAIPVAIAADVVLHFSTRELDPVTLPSELSNGKRAVAEERIRELSQWIQRTMPARIRFSRTFKTQSNANVAPPTSDALPGPLRLATRYLEQGKLDRARDLLRRAQLEFPDHPGTQGLWDRLEALSTSAVDSASEVQS
jgi:CDP-glycerol:poly(glycerophosphate) glycerophosphotransferase